MKVRTLALGLTKIEAANRVKRYFHTCVSLAASVETTSINLKAAIRWHGMLLITPGRQNKGSIVLYLMVKPTGGFLCNQYPLWCCLDPYCNQM